jgi:hypothetical protein
MHHHGCRGAARKNLDIEIRIVLRIVSTYQSVIDSGMTCLGRLAALGYVEKVRI